MAKIDAAVRIPMRYADLSSRDLKRISSFVAEMSRCEGFNEIEKLFHGEIRSLVDGDVSVWNEVNISGDIVYASTWPEFDARFWNELAPQIVANLGDHPLIADLRAKAPDVFAARDTDLPDYSHFIRTPLRNDVYRKWDCGHMIYSTWKTGGGGYLLLQVNRSHRNFSKRDFLVLDILATQASAIYRKQNLLVRLDTRLKIARCGLRALSAFWLSLGPHLYIRNASRDAHLHLQRIFNKGSIGFMLPDALKKNLLDIIDAWSTRGTPLENRTNDFKLYNGVSPLHLQFKQVDPKNYRLNGVAHKPSLSSESSYSSNEHRSLTKRELEVIHWIRLGKTNPEIATILGLKLTTVERPVSNIFGKLNLKSRLQLLSLAS